MNNEDLIKKLRRLRKPEKSIMNVVDNYVYGFGIGYNKAIEDIINLLENEKI